MRDQNDVVVAQDDFDLRAGAVQAQRPPGFGRDGDGPVAGLDADEPKASLHQYKISGILCFGEY
jgi:ABC-type xylose transport system substrate-binding protein